MEKTKICNKCKEEKEATYQYFGKSTRALDGLRGTCKVCRSKEDKQNYIDNKDKLKVINKKSYIKHIEARKAHEKQYRTDNVDKIKDTRKIWYVANKPQVLQNSRLYYQENKEQHAIVTKQWRDDNADKLIEINKIYSINNREKNALRSKTYREANLTQYAIYAQNRRSLKKLLPNNLTVEQWESIKKEFNYECAYCGKKVDLTIEHFIPVSKQGECTINNIIPACGSCNSSKGKKYFSKWYKCQDFYSKPREVKILKYLNYKNNNQQLALII